MGEEISRMVIAVLLVALVTTGVVLFIGGFSAAYPGTAQNVSASNFSFFNKTSNITQLAGNMSSNLQTQQGGMLETVINLPFMILTGAYQMTMLLFGIADIMVGLVGGFGIVLASVGISVGWALGIVYTIIVVIVLFAVAAVVLKWVL